MSISFTQPSSTHNHSLTTEMKSAANIDYDLIDHMDDEVDPQRLEAFKAEISKEGPGKLRGKTQTSMDKHTRSNFHTSPTNTRIASRTLELIQFLILSVFPLTILMSYLSIQERKRYLYPILVIRVYRILYGGLQEKILV